MLMHRPQTPHSGFGSITLLQKFTPHFKILDPRLVTYPTYPREKVFFNRDIDFKTFVSWKP